jgi:hypothetical protein
MSQVRYENLQQRLLANSVLCQETGCWLWVGRTTPDGYGLINFRLAGKHVTKRAHRVAYELLAEDEIEAEKELDHTCHNRACIHPNHVVKKDKLDNLANRRGYRSARR